MKFSYFFVSGSFCTIISYVMSLPISSFSNDDNTWSPLSECTGFMEELSFQSEALSRMCNIWCIAQSSLFHVFFFESSVLKTLLSNSSIHSRCIFLQLFCVIGPTLLAIIFLCVLNRATERITGKDEQTEPHTCHSVIACLSWIRATVFLGQAKDCVYCLCYVCLYSHRPIGLCRTVHLSDFLSLLFSWSYVSIFLLFLRVERTTVTSRIQMEYCSHYFFLFLTLLETSSLYSYAASILQISVSSESEVSEHMRWWFSLWRRREREWDSFLRKSRSWAKRLDRLIHDRQEGRVGGNQRKNSVQGKTCGTKINKSFLSFSRANVFSPVFIP